MFGVTEKTPIVILKENAPVKPNNRRKLNKKKQESNLGKRTILEIPSPSSSSSSDESSSSESSSESEEEKAVVKRSVKNGGSQQ